MAHPVVLSALARRDLQDIVRYISLDNPDRASSFGQFLIGKTRKLGAVPELGRAVPELGDPALREIIVRSYGVVYRYAPASGRVEGVPFWHAARGTPIITSQLPPARS